MFSLSLSLRFAEQAVDAAKATHNSTPSHLAAEFMARLTSRLIRKVGPLEPVITSVIQDIDDDWLSTCVRKGLETTKVDDVQFFLSLTPADPSSSPLGPLAEYCLPAIVHFVTKYESVLHMQPLARDSILTTCNLCVVCRESFDQ